MDRSGLCVSGQRGPVCVYGRLRASRAAFLLGSVQVPGDGALMISGKAQEGQGAESLHGRREARGHAALGLRHVQVRPRDSREARCQANRHDTRLAPQGRAGGLGGVPTPGRRQGDGEGRTKDRRDARGDDCPAAQARPHRAAPVSAGHEEREGGDGGSDGGVAREAAGGGASAHGRARANGRSGDE